MIDQHDIDRITGEIMLHRAVGETFAALIIWEHPEGNLTYMTFPTLKAAERAESRARNPNHVLVPLEQP